MSKQNSTQNPKNNSQADESRKTEEILLTQVLCEELKFIRHKGSKEELTEALKEGEKELTDVLKDFHGKKLSALCFSGGGIRSATFGLGIVQALAKNDLLDKFDYLSTVSGGGYLGAWLSAWIRREQMARFESGLNEIQKLIDEENQKETDKIDDQKILKWNDEKKRLNEEFFDFYNQSNSFGVEEVQKKLKNLSVPNVSADGEVCPNPEPEQLQHLREYSNYMSPKIGLLSADSWTLLGIYTRNLFLNWTIFIPLICAILLIPRILLTIVDSERSGRDLSVMLLIGFLAGTFAVVATVSKLPSKNAHLRKNSQTNDESAKENEIKNNNDLGVLKTVIFPLTLMAFATTTFWAWYRISDKTPEIYFESLRPYLMSEIWNFIIFSALIFVPGNLGFYLYQKTKFDGVKFKLWEFASALLSSILGGFLTWLIAYGFFRNSYFSGAANNQYHLPIYVCLAVPVYLLSFSAASAIFVGLNSRSATDEDREWLARQGALVFMISIAWILLNGLVLFAPTGLENLIGSLKDLPFKTPQNWIEYFSPLVPIIVAISGFVSLVGGFSGKSKVDGEPVKGRLSKFLAVAPRIAALVFLGSIFVVLAYISSLVLVLAGDSLNSSIQNKFTQNAMHLNILYQSSAAYLLVWLFVLLIIGIGMACFVNVNKFSLHAAYRDRLIRAYLGASRLKRSGNTFTGFDDADNFQLHRLKGQKPFHVINATLNLVAGKNLAWQNRKAASFTMSPLHCGSWLLGYRNTNEYCRNENLSQCEHLRFCNQRDEPCRSVEDCHLQGKALRLGTAMTISGAAANPNMGYYSSSIVTFLMSLFNIRLGWWLGNTGKRGDDKDWLGLGKEFYKKPSPSIAVLPLINETLGRTNEDKHFLNVTDGGHFENLGLYEMILRRCKFIVLSDAAADDNFTFGEISNAIEKCRVDLGVKIEFTEGINIYSRHQEVDDQTPKKRYALAEIIYPEKDDNKKNHRGKLLYIRPSFYENIEPTELKYYARSNISFPHQSTADQLYDEKQFEAYRSLGFCIMEEILQRKSAKTFIELLIESREIVNHKIIAAATRTSPDSTNIES